MLHLKKAKNINNSSCTWPFDQVLSPHMAAVVWRILEEHDVQLSHEVVVLVSAPLHRLKHKNDSIQISRL